jgi:hypothetical protein
MDPETEFQPFESSDLTGLQLLEEIEKATRSFIEELKEGNYFQRIKSRIPRHIAALDDLAKWCRAEIDVFGLWREDGADFDEICDAIADEMEVIEEELENDEAMSFALDRQELEECRAVASSMLASEKYLSGAELEFLQDVALGEIFDTRRLFVIARNHGHWFKAFETNEVKLPQAE